MDREEMLRLLKEGDLSPLEISIKKWEDIISSDGKEKGGFNCALCERYFNNVSPKNYCIGCPVHAETKTVGCNRTPFRKLINHQERTCCDGIIAINKCSRCTELANEELKFLKRLKEKQ